MLFRSPRVAPTVSRATADTNVASPVATTASECATGGDRAWRIAKPGAIGGLLGAGLGAAGGAIAKGGSGAGKGALIGGLVGAIVAAGLNGSEFEGIILGVGGALIGTFGGYLVRRELVLRLGSKDWPVALVEDASAILCAVLAMGIVTG